MDSITYDAITVFLVGILGIWKSIPLGLMLKLPPVYIFTMSAAGSVIGVLILYYIGENIRHRITNKRSKTHTKKKQKALKLFEKYGTFGVGFLGSLIIGPPMTIIVGLTFIPNTKHFLYWTLAGTVVWAFGLTMAGTYGISVFS